MSDESDPPAENAGPTEEAVQTAVAGVRSETLREQLLGEQDRMKAIAMAQEVKANQGPFGNALVATVFVVMVFIIAIIALLMFAPQNTVLADVAASRPILMLIIMLTTSIFGGILIYGAIFKKPEAAQFANGREVFLFFTGITATVVGFYFGTATNEGGAPPFSVVSALEDEGVIAVRVTSAQPATSVKLILAADSLDLINDPTDRARFTLTKAGDECPTGGVFEVSGAMGLSKQTFPASFTREQLAEKGWDGCETESTAETADEGGPNTTETATEAGAPAT